LRRLLELAEGVLPGALVRAAAAELVALTLDVAELGRHLDRRRSETLERARRIKALRARRLTRAQIMALTGLSRDQIYRAERMAR